MSDGTDIPRLVLTFIPFSTLSGPAALCQIPFALRIALLAFVLLLLTLVNPWRGWVKQVPSPISEVTNIISPGRRLRRPSNLLILLGAGVFAYWGLHEPCPGPRFWFFLGVITIVVGRVIHRWEQEADRN
jgi:hypothetical protein